MHRSPVISLLVALAFILTVTAQPLAGAPVRSHAWAHAAAKKTTRSGSAVAKKTAAAPRAATHGGARASARSKSQRDLGVTVRAGRGRSGAVAHSGASNRRVRSAGLPREARAVPAVMRTRRGALMSARRRAHAEDAPPPAMQQVRLAMPAPLRGSHESLVHQNEMAQADGLERILDDADLADRILHGSLVHVPVSSALRINTDLPENRRYCRPWTAKFLSDLAQAHAARFPGSPIEVTSAVRTVEYQRKLRLFNGNAAAADGDIASPHLTGGTIDIGKGGMSAREIGWLRAWLIPLEQAGKIDVEEEFRQSCFHISVYRNYMGLTPASTDKQLPPLASASMLASRLGSRSR